MDEYLFKIQIKDVLMKSTSNFLRNHFHRSKNALKKKVQRISSQRRQIPAYASDNLTVYNIHSGGIHSPCGKRIFQEI